MNLLTFSFIIYKLWGKNSASLDGVLPLIKYVPMAFGGNTPPLPSSLYDGTQAYKECWSWESEDTVYFYSSTNTHLTPNKALDCEGLPFPHLHKEDAPSPTGARGSWGLNAKLSTGRLRNSPPRFSFSNSSTISCPSSIGVKKLCRKTDTYSLSHHSNGKTMVSRTTESNFSILQKVLLNTIYSPNVHI